MFLEQLHIFSQEQKQMLEPRIIKAEDGLKLLYVMMKHFGHNMVHENIKTITELFCFLTSVKIRSHS